MRKKWGSWVESFQSQVEWWLENSRQLYYVLGAQIWSHIEMMLMWLGLAKRKFLLVKNLQKSFGFYLGREGCDLMCFGWAWYERGEKSMREYKVVKEFSYLICQLTESFGDHEGPTLDMKYPWIFLMWRKVVFT